MGFSPSVCLLIKLQDLAGVAGCEGWSQAAGPPRGLDSSGTAVPPRFTPAEPRASFRLGRAKRSAVRFACGSGQCQNPWGAWGRDESLWSFRDGIMSGHGAERKRLTDLWHPCGSCPARGAIVPPPAGNLQLTQLCDCQPLQRLWNHYPLQIQMDGIMI